MSDDVKVFKCPECGEYLERMYLVKEVEEMYPVKNVFDIANIKMQTDMNRYRKCPNCGHVEYLSITDLLKGMKRLGLGEKDFQEDLKENLKDES